MMKKHFLFGRTPPTSLKLRRTGRYPFMLTPRYNFSYHFVQEKSLGANGSSEASQTSHKASSGTAGRTGFIFMLIFSFLAPNIFSNSTPLPDQELFLSAAKLYEQEKFNDALQTYQKMESKGPAVWCNMGNCFFHLDNSASAIACWRRAQKDAPYQLWKKCEDQCKLVHQKNGTDITVNSVYSTLWHLYYMISKQLNIIWFQLLLLLCWSLLMIMGYHWITKRRRLYLALVASCAIISGLIVITHWYVSMQRPAIITPTKVVVYAGPHSTYHTIGMCNSGDEIAIDEERNAWYKIYCPSSLGWHGDTYGWIQKDLCEII